MNQTILKQIKNASIEISKKTEQEKNVFLKTLAQIIWQEKDEILKANKKDIKSADKNGLSKAFIQRLVLDESGIKKMIARVKKLQDLESNIGAITEERKLENGILLKKVRIPMGVLMVIFESRPEVTVDVTALCIKSGNGVILKGGSEAIYTNQALYKCIQSALDKSNISELAVGFVDDRKTVDYLLKQNKFIDLVIARGGYELVRKVIDTSKIPVLAHASGGARIYVDQSADLLMAEKIIINAKTDKPSACNSLDTILVHKDIATDFIPKIISKLQNMNVSIKEGDWDTEFLDLTVGIKVVNSADDAISFIQKHTKSHSEGIVASNQEVINQFINSLDAAAIFINCSTRLHDGFEFGLGSEIGISTGKLHARGPVGLKELTTYKWEVYGNGQIRG